MVACAVCIHFRIEFLLCLILSEGKIAQNVKPIDPSVKPPILPREKTSQATSASKIEVCKYFEEILSCFDLRLQTTVMFIL